MSRPVFRVPGFRIFPVVALCAAALFLQACSGVYFNTTFNAEKAYNQALSMRAKRLAANPDDTVKVTGDEKAKLVRAVTKASKVLELWPNDPKYAPRAVFLIAECQLLMEDYGSASYKYAEYIRYFPKEKNIPLARVRLAQALYLDGKRLAARETLAEVQDANPQGEVKREALLLAARMRIDDRSDAEGLELYEQLLKDEALVGTESRFELHWRAALLAFELGQWQKAREHALAANQAGLLPARVRFRNHRLAILSLYEMGRQREGLAEAAALWGQREFRSYRSDIKLLEARGVESQGNWPQAFKLYRETVRLGDRKSSAAEAWYRVGARYLDVENREDTARMYFDSAAAAGRGHEFGGKGSEIAEALKRLAELRAMDAASRDTTRLDTLATADSSATANDTTGLVSTDGSDDAKAREKDKGKKISKKEKEAREAKEKAREKARKIAALKPPSPQYAPFLIAELFQFRIPKPDSARAYLGRIVADTLQDSVYTRRAFYALAWLEENSFGNKARADSLYRVMLVRFPNTEWAKQAEKNLGLPPTVQTPDDKAHALFLEAEKRRFAGESVTGRVIPAYRAVGESYPKSPDAAKALFVIAFSTEQAALAGKHDTTGKVIDSVTAAYAVIRDKYPGTPHAAAAEAWINSMQSAPENQHGEDGTKSDVAPGPSGEDESSEAENEAADNAAPKVELLDPAAEQDLY